MVQPHVPIADLKPPLGGANGSSLTEVVASVPAELDSVFAPRTDRISPEMHERLQALRTKVWELQSREHQIACLASRTREYVRRHYSTDKAVFDKLNGYLEHIFKGGITADSAFNVPRRIHELQMHTPCIFTMFPGSGTHESLSQYDIVLVDRYSNVQSRSWVNLESQLTRSPATSIKLPITVANMRSAISEEMADIMIEAGMIPILHRFKRPTNPHDVDSPNPTVQTAEEARAEKIRWAEKYGERAFCSSGVSPESIEHTKEMIRRGIGGVVIDIALGNSALCAATVIELKEFITAGGYQTQIIAGNVDTAEGYFLLHLAGADCVKVGIGPGSACTTRGVTRAGAGQGSALIDVARAKFVLGEGAASFIADGGIQGSGDILVALALQASAVMIGKIASQTTESGALKRVDGNKSMAWYFGEASLWARLYEQGGVTAGMAVEGKGGWIPVTGSFRDLITELKGGLTNAFPYYNASSIPGLQQKYCIEQQLCDLILGGSTGIYKSAAGTGTESGTRLASN